MVRCKMQRLLLLLLEKQIVEKRTAVAVNPAREMRDGTWAKKNNKSFFGYKSHVKVDLETGIVEELAVTSASVHDSVIDLMDPNDIAYRDKGYFGAKTKARGDATMNRRVRGETKISTDDMLRNKRISKRDHQENDRLES